MNKKFHCGHLVIDETGKVEKVKHANGGGTRHCYLTHIDMGFEEIHDKLCEIFSLRTLIYLGTSTDHEDTVTTTSPEKRKTTQNLPKVVKRIPQVESDSSIPTVVIKVPDDSPPDIVDNLRRYLSIAHINYSFDISLKELINYLRNLINQSNQDQIFSYLLENIYHIYGISSLTLDRLKQQIHFINEYEKQIYNDILDKIKKLSRTIKILIELNKMKILHYDHHEFIIKMFYQFY